MPPLEGQCCTLNVHALRLSLIKKNAMPLFKWFDISQLKLYVQGLGQTKKYVRFRSPDRP